MARKKKTQRIGVIDAETDPFEPGVFVEPFIWGVMLDDGSYHEFVSTEELVAWLQAFEEKIILYAHNGGKFDYHFLRNDIEADSLISVIAGRLARCHIGHVELRDSLNLFGQTRLADFSKEEIDYRLMRRDRRSEPHNWELIRAYLKSDCRNLLTLVSSFIEKFGLQFTQAGAAMRYWQKHYAPRETLGSNKGYVPKSTAAFYDRFAPFYFGGRVQCFVSGHARENFSVVDINSAYPRAMMDAHPYDAQPLSLSRLIDDEKLPQCLIEIDAVAKGSLPIRASDRSLFFPDDEKKVRRYFTTGWELIAGLETNTLQIHKVHQCHYFGKPVNFAAYIEHFYNERANAKLAQDKAMDIFAKIFMNSLYGKWAACAAKRTVDEDGEEHETVRYREFVLSHVGSDAYAQWEAQGFMDHGTWGGRRMLVRPLPREKHRYYNIATAASITGWVRAFLWRSLLKCEGALYCDTDSIAARAVGSLDVGKKLGQWKLEAECDEYAIAGKKNYAFHIAGKPRPLDVKRQRPLARDETSVEWREMLSCWKLASKGSDMTPGEMIRAANGETVKCYAQVPNFSIHRNEFTFIDRDVRSTYRDISNLDAYENAA